MNISGPGLTESYEAYKQMLSPDEHLFILTARQEADAAEASLARQFAHAEMPEPLTGDTHNRICGLDALVEDVERNEWLKAAQAVKERHKVDALCAKFGVPYPAVITRIVEDYNCPPDRMYFVDDTGIVNPITCHFAGYGETQSVPSSIVPDPAMRNYRRCECAKEKFGFMTHERWCPEYMSLTQMLTAVTPELPKPDYHTNADKQERRDVQIRQDLSAGRGSAKATPEVIHDTINQTFEIFNESVLRGPETCPRCKRSGHCRCGKACNTDKQTR